MRRLTLIAPLLLTACAGAAVGPSLSKRPIESLPLTEPASEAAAPAAADAELRGRIDALLRQAREGQSGFAGLLPRARQAAGAAGAEGSESWIAAQQLLSALDDARAPTTRAMAELDALAATRVNTGSDAGLAELQAAAAEVSTLAGEQARTIDSLREQVRR
jgi:hypothetical protein